MRIQRLEVKDTRKHDLRTGLAVTIVSGDSFGCPELLEPEQNAIMKTIKTAVTSGAVLGLLLFTCSHVEGQGAKVDRVMMKNGKMQMVQGGRTVDMTEEVRLPHDITASTNGTFKVKEGKERQLKEGQELGSDGMLSSPDGSVVPVYDHVMMKNGRPMVTRDGDTSPLATTMTLSNGRRIQPDGYTILRDGRTLRMLDGQMYTLDGKSITAKDTISLKDGKVIVQKDGSLFEVPPGRTLMMNDGTKVFGEGKIESRDGRTRQLTDGEIITVEGVVVRR